MIQPAVAAVARFEWRRRWRGLLALGLIAGAMGGVIIGAAALTRRTATAPDRLADRVRAGDVHLEAIGDPDLAGEIADLPIVSGAWAGRLSVARVEGPAVQYVGVLAEMALGETAGASSPFEPVVVAGRSADDDAVDEAMLREDAAAALGLGIGDVLRLAFLTPEEIGQFDTGFGEPDGPTVDMSVVGIVRVPPGVLDGSPVITTRAFAAAHPEVAAGTHMFVELHGGSSAVPAFTTEVDEVVASRPRPAATEDFAPVSIDDPRAGTAALVRSSRVLVGGLIAALVVAVLAALVVCAQAWGRHFAASSGQQQIEAALGLSARDRIAARVLPSMVVAGVAALVAAAIGLAASGLEPVGGLSRVEPDEGWRVDVVAIVIGGFLVYAVMVGLAAAAAARAGSQRVGVPRRSRSAAWRVAPRRRGWPLAGTTFARSSGDPRQSRPVTMSLAANVVGVGGLVAAIIFAASLDRLTETPARYGWQGDMTIVDVNDDIVGSLVADARVVGVADVLSSTVRVDGSDVEAYSFAPVAGRAEWTIMSGRLPVDRDEVMLGTRLADRLDVEVGDRMDLNGVPTSVVGVGLGPPMNGEQLGSSVLFSPDGLMSIASVGVFREALVQFAPGVPLDAVAEEFGGQYEITVRELPAEVRRVADLGSLPIVLGSFLALLAAMALAHALTVTARRRARDLAVLRAIGSTPGQTGLTIVTMAFVTITVGIVIGVPVGWAVARLVWGELAHSIGVRGDVVVTPAVGVAVAGAVVVAVLLALPAAIRVWRQRPADLLRAD